VRVLLFRKEASREADFLCCPFSRFLPYGRERVGKFPGAFSFGLTPLSPFPPPLVLIPKEGRRTVDRSRSMIISLY
jgi:hypothetical protein